MALSTASAQTSIDDTRLVSLMQAGDERALATLYDRHAPTLLGLVTRMVRERAAAEAVLLATFLQAWRTAAAFSARRGSVLDCLATIARSRALDFARSGARRNRREQLVHGFDERMAESVAPAAMDPLDGIAQQERRRTIEAALTSLSAAQRTAIELAFFEGLTHVEIAERLAEPLGTIKNAYSSGDD